ncbi:MAG: TonB-dependent receptor [Halioglobus sp.]
MGGDKRPYVPNYTASLVANYEHTLTPAITGLATLGYRYRSGGRVPGLIEIDMDSYNLLDAQVGIRFNNVQVAGFVQNVLNDDYVVGNYQLASGQVPYVAASGLSPITTRVLLRDPGAVFGVRITVIL